MRATLTALGALAIPTVAHAGGLGGRPNNISARGEGMGGAFVAFADDATALYFNPAGLDLAEPQVDVGGEYVYATRSYAPADGTAKQSGTVSSPIPTVGALGRFDAEDGRPSRLTFGAGIWNTYGGQLRFPKTGLPAYDYTEDVMLEATVGAAVHVSDKLSLGAALRVGVGLFAIDATQKPFDASLSGAGAGVGATVGAMFRPVEEVSIGVAWRSPMKVSTTGNGTVTQIDTPKDTTVSHTQNWPQSVSLGVGVHASDTVKLAAQVDWTGWSRVDEIVVNIEALGPSGLLRYPEYWKDAWTARAGADVQVSPELALRAGAYVETNAVPDRAMERQYFDSTKFGAAVGGSYAIGQFRIDAAFDAVLPATRTVPDNSAETTQFPADRNIAPGTYEGAMYTFALSGAYRF